MYLMNLAMADLLDAALGDGDRMHVIQIIDNTMGTQ
jgi:hypothetical protein